MELVNAMKARLALLLSAASAVCSPFSIEVESSRVFYFHCHFHKLDRVITTPSVVIMMKTKLETL